MWLKLAGGDPYPCNVPHAVLHKRIRRGGNPPPHLRGAHCRCVSTDIHGDVFATPHVRITFGVGGAGWAYSMVFVFLVHSEMDSFMLRHMV